MAFLSCSDDGSNRDGDGGSPDVEILARINEFSAKSSSDTAVPNSDLDWLEIKNTSNAPLKLEGYYLTDDPTLLTKWKIPEVELEANNYLLIYLSKDSNASGANIIAPLELDADGDYLALVHSNGQSIVDEFDIYPKQRLGVSYGIDEEHLDADHLYFTTPTPGRKNVGESFAAITNQPNHSRGRGYVEESFELTLNAEDGADIYYTTDGSDPSPTSGTLYQTPLRLENTTLIRSVAIKENQLNSDFLSHTYIFYDDIFSQPAAPLGFPLEWQPDVVADYDVDPSLATQAIMKKSLHAYPTVSLWMPMDDWFNPNTDPAVGGIYSNSVIARGMEWERKVSAEFIGFHGESETHTDAGIRIFGNASRATTRGKHNMRLVFRKEYGVGKLNFPLFGDDESKDNVNGYLLRGGNGDSWIHPTAWVQEQAVYIRDQFARSLHEKTGAFEVPQDHVHLYINGLYWGLYHSIERIEASSMAKYFGGEEEEWDVVKSSRDSMQIVDGNLDSWMTMQDIATEVATGLKPLSELEKVLDIEEFVDYLVMNFYAGNRDWDHNNFQAAKRRTGDDKWRIFQWDSEHVIRELGQDSSIKNNIGRLTGMHHQLLALPEYRDFYAERINLYLKNDGLFTPRKAAGVFAEWAEKQRLPLIMETIRWGDYDRPGQPYLVDVEWQAEVDRMLFDYFPNRTQEAIDQMELQLIPPAPCLKTQK